VGRHGARADAQTGLPRLSIIFVPRFERLTAYSIINLHTQTNMGTIMNAKTLMLNASQTSLRVARLNYQTAQKRLDKARHTNDAFKIAEALREVNRSRQALDKTTRVVRSALSA
jgi:hypothetical protein